MGIRTIITTITIREATGAGGEKLEVTGVFELVSRGDKALARR